MATTINVTTSGDIPKAWKNNGGQRPIYKMEECYAMRNQIRFVFNGEDYTFDETDTLNVNGSPVAGDADTKAAAIQEALKSFFPKAPGTGGGGGGTYTLNVGEQTIVASSPGQTEFTLTGGATLPANKVKIQVYKNTARLEQADFTRSSSNTITLSSYWAAIVGDRIIISWVDLISA